MCLMMSGLIFLKLVMQETKNKEMLTLDLTGKSLHPPL